MVVGCWLLVVGCWLVTFPIIQQNNKRASRQKTFKKKIHT